MKKRMLSQDIAKGLGILIVIQLHALQLTAEIFYPVVALYGFVMPFFIFMSGYNYRPKGLSPVQMVKKRVGMLLKVYVLWTLGIFVVMGFYFLIRGNAPLPDILRSFAGAVFSESGCKMMGWKLPVSLFQHVLGPFWFLQYLITASLVFCFTADYALRSLKNTFSVTVLLSAVTFALVRFGVLLPWGLHCAPLLAAIMIAGAKLGENDRLFTAASTRSWRIVNSLVCLAIVDLIQISFPSAGILGAGLLGETAGAIEVLFAFCFAVFGSYFLIHLGRLLEKVPFVSKGLIWCGQHTLVILCLHRPVAYVIRDCMKLPHFISGDPLYVDRITAENLIAFLLIFAVMVPAIMAWDCLKRRKAGQKAAG